VSDFKLGDQVLGMVQRGYAEFVTAAANRFALVPKGLDVKDAAALPVVALHRHAAGGRRGERSIGRDRAGDRSGRRRRPVRGLCGDEREGRR